MESQGKQADITGSGAIETPILAQDAGRTGVRSKPSQKNTSIALSSSEPNKLNDKPLTQAEALSLLQTRFSDLRSLGLNVAIVANGGVLYAAVQYQGHELGFDGHILLDGQPVVKG